VSSSARPTLEQLARYASVFNQSAAIRPWGLKVSFSADRVFVHLDEVKPEQRGGLGTDAVNGAVLAGIFDLAIGCTPALLDPSRKSATAQLSISFMRPVRGNRLRAEAWVDSAGKRTVFSTAIIYDEAGEACSRCQGMAQLGSGRWGDSPLK